MRGPSSTLIVVRGKIWISEQIVLVFEKFFPIFCMIKLLEDYKANFFDLSLVSFFCFPPFFSFFLSYLSIIRIVISYIWIVFSIRSILILWILFSIFTFSWTNTIQYSLFVKFHEQKLFGIWYLEIFHERILFGI